MPRIPPPAGGETPIDLANADRVTELRRIGRRNLTSVAISIDGRLLAAATTLGIRIYDGKTLATLAGHTEGVRTLASLSEGRLLATGSSGGTVRFWGVR